MIRRIFWNRQGGQKRKSWGFVKNFLFAFVAQIYTAFVGILLMPVYLHTLGTEGFGIVGLFFMLQVVVQLLDCGLSSAASREASVYCAQKTNEEKMGTILSSLEVSFFSASLVVLVCFVLTMIYTDYYPKPQILSQSTVVQSMILIGFATALRFFSGLYRSILVGLEKQVEVNLIIIVGTTVRYLIVLPFIHIWPTVQMFMLFQIIAGIGELLSMAYIVRILLPRKSLTFSSFLDALKQLLPIAIPMAILSSLWIGTTQIDRVILSIFLSLEDFSIYTLVTMATGGILLILPPLNQILQPRLTLLCVLGQDKELLKMYRLTTQMTIAIFAVLGGTLAFYSKPILWVWTGNHQIASEASQMMFWYALGTSVIGFTAIPFLLQFARGQLHFHVWINAFFFIISVPLIWFLALRDGAIGAAKAILLMRIIYLLWIPIVHCLFLPQLSFFRYCWDVVPVTTVVFLVLWTGGLIVTENNDRFIVLIELLMISVLAFVSGMLSSGIFRDWLRQKFYFRQI